MSEREKCINEREERRERQRVCSICRRGEGRTEDEERETNGFELLERTAAAAVAAAAGRDVS